MYILFPESVNHPALQQSHNSIKSAREESGSSPLTRFRKSLVPGEATTASNAAVQQGAQASSRVMDCVLDAAPELGQVLILLHLLRKYS